MKKILIFLLLFISISAHSQVRQFWHDNDTIFLLKVPEGSYIIFGDTSTVYGVIKYDIDSNKFFFRQNGEWDTLGGGAGGGVTINNNADTRILTATGTANTIDGETSLTVIGNKSLKLVDSTGTLSIGNNVMTIGGLSGSTDGYIRGLTPTTDIRIISGGQSKTYITNTGLLTPETNPLYVSSNHNSVTIGLKSTSGKWEFGTNSSNHFVLYDSVNNVYPFRVYANSGSYMYNFNSVGLGIGIVNLNYKLKLYRNWANDVYGNIANNTNSVVWGIYGTTDNFVIGDSAAIAGTKYPFTIERSYNSNYSVWIDNTGKVGILKSNPTYDLDVTGVGRITDDFRLDKKTVASSFDTLLFREGNIVKYGLASRYASADSIFFTSYSSKSWLRPKTNLRLQIRDDQQIIFGTTDTTNRIGYYTDGDKFMISSSANDVLIQSGGTNAMMFDKDNEIYVYDSLILEGGLYYKDTFWDDVRIDATSTRVGVTAPAFEAYRGGTGLYALFFENNHDDAIYFNIQLPHGYKPGTDVGIHLHCALPVAGVAGDEAVWELEFSGADINAAFPTTDTITSYIDLNGKAAYTHYIFDIGDISGTSLGESSVIICRLTRLSSTAVRDDYADKIAMLYIDAHVQIEKPGSDNEIP